MSIEEVNIDPPRREVEHHRPCLCRLIYKDQPGRVDACRATTTDPDTPLCHPCTESGHENQPHIPYADVLRGLP